MKFNRAPLYVGLWVTALPVVITGMLYLYYWYLYLFSPIGYYLRLDKELMLYYLPLMFSVLSVWFFAVGFLAAKLWQKIARYAQSNHKGKTPVLPQR